MNKTPNLCKICTLHKDEEDKELLKSVLHRLRKIYSELNQENLVETNKGFKKLMLVTFEEKYKHNKATNRCLHKTIKRNWENILACTEKEFNFICNKFTLEVKRICYQEELLLSQMKSFTKYLKPLFIENNEEEEKKDEQNKQLLERASNIQWQDFISNSFNGVLNYSNALIDPIITEAQYSSNYSYSSEFVASPQQNNILFNPYFYNLQH